MFAQRFCCSHFVFVVILSWRCKIYKQNWRIQLFGMIILCVCALCKIQDLATNLLLNSVSQLCIETKVINPSSSMECRKCKSSMNIAFQRQQKVSRDDRRTNEWMNGFTRICCQALLCKWEIWNFFLSPPLLLLPRCDVIFKIHPHQSKTAKRRQEIREKEKDRVSERRRGGKTGNAIFQDRCSAFVLL